MVFGWLRLRWRSDRRGTRERKGHDRVIAASTACGCGAISQVRCKTCQPGMLALAIDPSATGTVAHPGAAFWIARTSQSRRQEAVALHAPASCPSGQSRWPNRAEGYYFLAVLPWADSDHDRYRARRSEV
jgi:hypothetical protein